MRKFLAITISAVILSTAATPFALSAKQTVKKELTRDLGNGQTVVELVEAEKVTPGEKVAYVFDILNDENQEVSDLVLAMPVPKEIQFIEGSADREGASVLYSTDGGQSFAPRSALTVVTGPSGPRPATRDDITHIQWKISGPIAIGASDSVLFKGRLR